MNRQPLVLANWKMNGSRQANSALVARVLHGLASEQKAVDVAICPPAIYLSELAHLLIGSELQLGAQDVSEHPAGAHTGDVAAEMLQELGCQYVIVGHSERRTDHHESDEQVAQKFWRALEAGLVPVLCVGETLEQRQAGNTLKVIEAQLSAVLKKVNTPPAMIVAYEPVWAIGTGQTATVEQAQEVHAFIRSCLGVNGSSSRILYGGSVKPENAKELFDQPDIDGGLIGGASLEAESFVAICKAARKL